MQKGSSAYSMGQQTRAMTFATGIIVILSELTLRWNWMLMKWGCTPSDCQYVSSRPSRSRSTPLPGLELVTVHTARCPISQLFLLGVSSSTISAA